MSKRTTWTELKARQPLTDEGRAAYVDEARVSAFRELVFRLRTEAGLTQAELAERMGTTQSAVARLETTAMDAKISTVERYADSLGYVVQYHLIPADSGAGKPPVVVH